MLTFAPDLFLPAVVNVWLDGQPVGTITAEGARYAATREGVTRRFGTRAAAVACLTGYRAVALTNPAPVGNQISLF